MPSWAKYLIIALVAVIVLSIIFSLINRKFKRTYGINLFVGGFFLLLAVGAIAGGVLLGLKVSKFGYALILVGLIIAIIVFVQDVKKCGGVGVVAWLCQLVFCVPTIFLIFDLVFNKGRSTAMTSSRYGDRDMRYYREQQRKKRNDDYYDY